MVTKKSVENTKLEQLKTQNSLKFKRKILQSVERKVGREKATY